MVKRRSTRLHFHFQLRQLADIEPWRGADGSHPHLGWFGLSDGWYWIEAGSAELFRYSRPLVDKWKSEYSGEPWMEALPYVDYQVVRLWEDILEILPAALEPIPLPLTRMLGSGGSWLSWSRTAEMVVEQALPSDEGWSLLDAASGWWWSRHLDTAYLQAGPQIWFWCDDSSAHIQWDNRECVLDGLPAWEAAAGDYTLPVADFVADVRDVDMRFIARMHDRITIAQAEWSRPDVALDADLDQEQAARSHQFERYHQAAEKRESTDWSAVFRAISRIEELPEFPPEHALRVS